MGELLATYLRDHHAGATAGSALAGRAAASNRESEYGEELGRIASEIVEDKESLERIMAAVGVKPDPVKDGAAWVGEKLGRLKPNGSVISYSPLSRVIELEGLVIGVTAKEGLWEALRESVGAEIDGVAIDRLTERAAHQRRRLEELRRTAASEAFGGR